MARKLVNILYVYFNKKQNIGVCVGCGGGGRGGGVLILTDPQPGEQEKKKTRGSADTHQKLVCNAQAFTHWTNSFQFISMTKDTIILDMPECYFH